HDLIIVVGVYALFGKELSPNTIAALLTILGYSLYDTVVVFHRINDNMQQEGVKHTFMTMANHSINQVFIRSMNTTLTSLIPVLAMLFFGSETLKDFAFAMTIGLVFGAYSSVAIASPIYAIWKSKEPRYAKLISKYGANVELMEFDHAGKPMLNLETKRLFTKEELDQKMKVAEEEVEDMSKKTENAYSSRKAIQNKGPGSKTQYKKAKKARQKAKKKNNFA
ncbi:MAG: protein translocase subunit SecF, partial [Eggerthellaceae bacterium]|nr:protein translocase subunit SecF [Eggerthellaceae bacterium]